MTTCSSESAMSEFSDEDIRREAFRIWEADGRPLWSHGYDNWFRATENLRRERLARQTFDDALPGDEREDSSAPPGPNKG